MAVHLALYLAVQLKTPNLQKINKRDGFQFLKTGNGEKKEVKYPGMLLVCVGIKDEKRYWWIFENVEAMGVKTYPGQSREGEISHG